MRDAMVTYFAGEKAQGWFWLATGLAMAGFAVALLLRGSTLRAMGWPMIVIALIQVGAGIWLLSASDGRAAELSAKFAADAGATGAAELTRMRGVMRAFTVIEIVELVLLAAGVVVTLVARNRPTLFAAACGLIVQAAAMYVLDLAAENRGASYLAALESAR